MKRLLPILFALVTLLSLAACSDQAKYSTNANFYYCVNEFDYALDASVIKCEERTVNYPSNEYKSIIQEYLHGPRTHNLKSPFPQDLSVTELVVEDDTTYITFSTDLSYLTGTNLSLACICIAKTCFDLTQTQNVDISAEHATLDNAPSVFISRNSILLNDDY